VIEAIVEKLPVKQKVFAEVAGEVADDTVLASNTSALSIDAIAKDTPHPERVVGMHFFNPVDKMPLIEVIAGARSADWAVETVVALARDLGKVPVRVKDSPGFLVNRLLTFSLGEALWLVDGGYAIEDIDRAMKSWGMPIGPVALTDEVGIDIAIEVAHTLNDAYGDRLPLPPWVDKPQEDGRLGKKNGKGFYRYDKHERKDPDPSVYELIGVAPTVEDPDSRTIVDRMVLRMVDEAARCLEEEVVASPADLDLAMILGAGFPPFRGGVCRYADQRGVAQIVQTLERLAKEVGPRYEPSEALRKVAEKGGFY
jgi:3-hydroxyacyl-CoA dehydrogenase / enoyl-CoA hydratase / 3-hydroxybutyryl-CoA epimerase